MSKWGKYEQGIAKQLGLTATPRSGAGWISKEDMESDKILAQLKSTEGKSISVKRQDVDDLVINARIARKLPVFVLSFVGEDQPWLMVKANQLTKVAKYIGQTDNKGKDKEASETRHTSNVRRHLWKAPRRNNV